jgi:hypothetical protein
VHTIDAERIFLVRKDQGLIFQMMLPKGQVNQAEVTAYTFTHITAATLAIIFLGRGDFCFTTVFTVRAAGKRFFWSHFCFGMTAATRVVAQTVQGKRLHINQKGQYGIKQFQAGGFILLLMLSIKPFETLGLLMLFLMYSLKFFSLRKRDEHLGSASTRCIN